MSGGKATSTTYSTIYAVVRRIPRGRVASYGQVARVAGLRNAARQVGYALHALPRGSTVPWQRVLNAQGAISLRDHHALTQRMLLTREGVRFDGRGRVDLACFGWKPRVRTNQVERSAGDA
jgi:methylated-DNA-protein-cysteine methyltransferase-like protein